MHIYFIKITRKNDSEKFVTFLKYCKFINVKNV